MGKKASFSTTIMDDINKKIIEILRKDAKSSLKEIGAEVGLSCSSVGERIKKQEQLGIILGYSAIIDEEMLGFPITAIIAIKCHSPQKEKALLQKLPKEGPVRQFWNVTGDIDIYVEATFPSMKELNEFLNTLYDFGRPSTSIAINKPYKIFSM
ncbi:Lrp/AsnC family transcriptional regulator [Thermovirga sp.]|uniref:Lrp/AsnC family transcriptional regulator n=1 Tax=Thermovirga sp. TaxID=2699834 RepID=UPI0025D52A40|nr:Lrp/AsnC family transcriptional regulator [Thermovirga sp.]MBO8153900.1 Lrp/AsnC family transcriptional regulator [Thermovirga sp.]